MPTALIEPPFTMKASFSTNTTPRLIHTSKTPPIITKAVVVSFEKRSDQKIWYTIRVEPLASKKYFISRKYEDFSQFSQKLHDRFNTSKYRAGSRLPPKIKSRLYLLPPNKQIHAQRVQELNQFLTILFQKQSIITDSYIVLDFFENMLPVSPTSVEKMDLDQEQQQENTPSRWKRLRCTSFLARSPPSPTSSSNSMVSLCSQAANRIIPSWHRNNVTCTPQPSLSTPTSKLTSQKQQSHFLKKSKSSMGIYRQQQQQPTHPLDDDIYSMTVTPSISSSMTTHTELKSTIKIKVIYDVDNIIVIQVPRSITLFELRYKISQKFSDPKMHATILKFSDNGSSCCSIASNDTMLPAIIINKEIDLQQIMQTKWNRLEKVTLRCII